MASHRSNNEERCWLLGIVCASFCLLFLLSISPGGAAENPLHTVLILNSYHRGYKWTDDQNAGIEAALKGSVNQNHIYVEYMDAGRMTHDKDFHDLYLAYKRKYRGLDFNVICVTDAEALRFMLDYREKLFPHAPNCLLGYQLYQ